MKSRPVHILRMFLYTDFFFLIILIRTAVIDYCSYLRLQFCSYFQWESHKECQTIFTTFSRKDEATHNVRILFSPFNNSLVFFFGHESLEDMLMLLEMIFSGLSSEADQVKEDQFISVVDLGGSLSCCFPQVGSTPSFICWYIPLCTLD